MPRRASSRLRGAAAAGIGLAGASDGENGSSGAGAVDKAALCPPVPPSPGKRKTRSPVEEIQGGPSAPSAVRCTSLAFQSPKKKASADTGSGGSFNAVDRFHAAPFDKENDLAAGVGAGSGSSGMDGAFAFGAVGQGELSSRPCGAGAAGPGPGAGSFRLSAFSAFSYAPKTSSATAVPKGREGAKRRARETSTTPGRGLPAPGGHRSPHQTEDLGKPSPLPFLLVPASVTSSPDLSNKSGSRRTRRTTRLGRSRESSSSNGSASPVPTTAPSMVTWRTAAGGVTGQHRGEALPDSTPLPPRGRSKSGAGCVAGGRRAASNSATASNACPARSTPGKGSSGGGPAGACRGECEASALSEPDCSPHRSPVHRLTESLQKWAPGSRYKSDEGAGMMAIGERGERRNSDSARSGRDVPGVAGAAASIRNIRAGVGASWSGQELRRTLEQERLAAGAVSGDAAVGGLQGHRRTRSAHTTEEVMYPQDRFRDSPAYSPISPASSAASINLASGGERAGNRSRSFAFITVGGGGTPPSAGRPWRSSPARASESGGTGDSTGSTSESFIAVRMQGSWSDDEGESPEHSAMRLAFSPGGDERQGSKEGESGRQAEDSGTADASEAAAATAAAATLSARPWQGPFSPVKGKHPPGIDAFGGGGPAAVASGELVSPTGDSAFLLGSPAPSRIARRDFLAADSPVEHSLRSVRDLMDDGTDEDEGDGGDGRLFRRRRRRRPRPELALRALEMPDASDVTVVEGEADGLGGSTTSASGGSMMMTMDDDEVAVTTTETVEVKDEAAAAAAAAAAGKKATNNLVSPATMKSKGGLGGGGRAFESGGCPTACPRWEDPGASDTAVLLEATRVDAHVAPSTLKKSCVRERASKGKGNADSSGDNDNWEHSTSGCGTGSSPTESGQDSTGILKYISGFCRAEASATADTCISFVKSRPIPDQAAFSSTRSSKGGLGAPLSPTAGGGGGPATGPPGPLCVTPRKSVMRCPPTPQRTPTWDGLEDSLLLEGTGSAGRGGGPSGVGISGGCGLGSSIRHSLRSHSKSACGGSSGGASTIGGAGDSMTVDTGLAHCSYSVGSARTASLLVEAADGESKLVNGGTGARADMRSSGNGSGYDQGTMASQSWGRAGAGGRGGRGRGGKERISSDTAAGGGVGHGEAASEGMSSNCAQRGAGAQGARPGGDGALGFKHDFVRMGPIGEGGFSVVWKVRARGTGQLYAIKRSKREFRGRRDRDRCLLEARALQRLGEHPGVLRFERAWQEEGHFCLQTELCELGTLKDFLERLPSRREIPEPAVWQVLHDVGQALQHVHGMQLVHLDVKPANLLIGDEGGRLKLADFGMATVYGEGADGFGDGQEGDTLYMAKELLSSTKRVPSADMFSLGLTVYEVATRAQLPGDGEEWHAMRAGRSGGLPASRSPELGKLVRQLMHPDPARRPTAKSLCKHPRIAAISAIGYSRDDYVVNQARAWRAAEAAAMDHPSNGLRTPTGDMSARYIFQQTG